MLVRAQIPYYIHFIDELQGIDINWQSYSDVVLFSDDVVASYHLQTVLKHLPNPPHVFTFPDGETYKTRETKALLEDYLLELQLGRDILIIALGGGVVLDLIGFLAATYCRGVDVFYLPTSLMAMVDASMGGKTAVNTKHGKNMIGVFHQPIAVYMYMPFLYTLSDRQFLNGLSEVCKHAFILDKELIDWLRLHRERILARDINILQQMLKKSCVIKESVVYQDEFEQGMREILNFGHTIGHALEVVSEYRLLHGEAVAIGMVIESFIAHQLGYLHIEQVNQLIEVLRSFHLPISDSCLRQQDGLLSLIQLDKKTKQQLPHMVILKDLGQCLLIEDNASFPISEHIIRQALCWGSQLC